MIQNVLSHLEALVGFDTQNPPRHPNPDIFDYIVRALPGFSHHVTDHGAGCQSLLCIRGTPKILCNVHLDTVPAALGYSANPFTLRVEGGRAIGLGACDIKGAAACLLTAAAHTEGDVAFLFTTDEEAGNSTCVRAFCAQPHPFEVVLVGEPTQARAVVEHRGIQTARAEFVGVSGHASSGRADLDSALHHAVDWASGALQRFRVEQSRSYKNLTGLRYNLGQLEGGVKPNMIAASAHVSFGFRPLPGMDAAAFLEELRALQPTPHALLPGFYGPPLPAPGHPTADAPARHLGLPMGDPVDFWTEASLFSEAGYHALVFGPGNIAQAHTADEWVALDDLVSVTQHYTRIFA